MTMCRYGFFLLCVGLAGCAHFSRPGQVRTASFHGPGEEAQEEVSAPMDYTPTRRGQAKGYKPRRAFSLSWPLNLVKVNQPFRPMKKRRPHLGVDLAGTKGTPVFAAHEGLVIYAGRAFKGFGKVVIIEYDDRWASIYAHLDKIQVKQGQAIAQGELVGAMGRTGRATGVHLHFELLHDQRPIDPIPRFQDFERLVHTDTSKQKSPASL